ncbi:MAG: winged helix DNA-binding domain-containing protein [Actinomycetota bacterium]
MAEIRRILKRDAPLTRPQLAERLRRKGIRTDGQAIAHLVWLAAAEGVCCYGPEIDGEPAFVLLDEWVGARRPLDRDAALAELAVRYLRSHGPATVADLAGWSGIKASDANHAWQAIENRLKEVPVGRNSLWTIKSQRGEARPGLVRLLPAFDEYVLGWKDRGLVVPSQHWKKINAGGGWLHPMILSDGRAVGTWATERGDDGLDVRTRPFSALGLAMRKGVQAEAKDIGLFLGTQANARFD